MRILIVEDEIVSRTKMETIMRSFGDCELAENGQQAIECFKQAIENNNPFKLVTLDINMPDVQGTQVLSQLRKIEQGRGIDQKDRCFIVMVTSQSDRDHVLNCVQTGCDDFIAKPFNIALIRKKLEKLNLSRNIEKEEHREGDSVATLTADAIFKDINRALRRGELNLPSLPQLSSQFRQLVFNNADMEHLAALLKKDMAIAAKVIRISNSAFYRGFGTVTTIEQAISRLGLSTTDQMVTALSNQQLFATESPKYKKILENLWRHSLASAYAADALQNGLSTKLAVDPFTDGLLHDIGALALIQITAEMDARKRFPEEIDTSALFDTIKSYHNIFGAKLLEKWQFEIDYIRAALYHNRLQSADSLSPDLLIIHLSNCIAKALGFTIFEDEQPPDIMQTQSAVKLNLSDTQLGEVQDAVKERMTHSEELILAA